MVTRCLYFSPLFLFPFWKKFFFPRNAFLRSAIVIQQHHPWWPVCPWNGPYAVWPRQGQFQQMPLPGFGMVPINAKNHLSKSKPRTSIGKWQHSFRYPLQFAILFFTFYLYLFSHAKSASVRFQCVQERREQLNGIFLLQLVKYNILFKIKIIQKRYQEFGMAEEYRDDVGMTPPHPHSEPMQKHRSPQ